MTPRTCTRLQGQYRNTHLGPIQLASDQWQDK